MHFPKNLTKIDKLSLPDHPYLKEDDLCWFLGEYTAQEGFGYSDINQLIINLKKPMSRRGKPEWKYKGKAIRTAAAALKNAIPSDWSTSATFVPIPPSQAKSDPMHDDRMLQVLNSMGSIDVRELVHQELSTIPAHITTSRPTPQQLHGLYGINWNSATPLPSRIVIVDDVLTTGAHFKAAQRLLSGEFGNVEVVGVFIARRVPRAGDPDSTRSSWTRSG